MSIDPHLSSTAGIEALKKVYRDGLLNDTLPFWIKHSVDRKYGGFTICLDRDGTEKRGLIKPGCFADLFIFSPEEIGTKATYLKPDIPADGIHHVMVNGDWEVYKGKLTGKLMERFCIINLCGNILYDI
jgi:hypothetical protein